MHTLHHARVSTHTRQRSVHMSCALPGAVGCAVFAIAPDGLKDVEIEAGASRSVRFSADASKVPSNNCAMQAAMTLRGGHDFGAGRQRARCTFARPGRHGAEVPEVTALHLLSRVG